MKEVYFANYSLAFVDSNYFVDSTGFGILAEESFQLGVCFADFAYFERFVSSTRVKLRLDR